MPFTLQELENAANATLDFYVDKGRVDSQTIQEKPLHKAMLAAQETFPGGKEYISGAVKGEYTTTIQGFQSDDAVSYSNPANIKRYNYPWKLIHSGIQFTMHELLKNGISIVDTTSGKGEARHSEAEEIQLADVLKDKVEDMMEGTERGFNEMWWGDGTSDPDLVPGITSFILNDPTTATVVGGIDQSANSWWRNRANVSITATTASDQNLINTLQGEFRQLRRYGGRPNKALAGSDMIEWMEKELRSKGNYTLEGWTSKKATDGGMADVSFKGLTFEYDPSLDDAGKADYLYLLDMRYIKPKVIDGEDMKKHYPARPENKYVFYRALTWAGGLICNKRNAHGVYKLA